MIGDADGSFSAPAISRDHRLFNDDRSLSARVGEIVGQIVTLPEVGRVLMEKMRADDKRSQGFIIEYWFPIPVFASDSTGAVRHVERLRITLSSERNTTPVKLRGGGLKDAQIAGGQGDGEAGKLLVAIVEREGQEPTMAVDQQKGGMSKRIVNVDEKGALSVTVSRPPAEGRDK